MNAEQKLLEKWRELPLDKQQEVLQLVLFLLFRKLTMNLAYNKADYGKKELYV